MNNTIARTFRKTLVSAIAVSALTIPLFASAAASQSIAPDRNLLNAQPAQVKADDPEMIYSRLKDQSRDVCGSDNVRITGDLRRAAQNEQCYEGTLNAAVLRLDNDDVSQLHQN